MEQVHHVIDRVVRRAEWHIAPSAIADTYQVRTSEHDVIADGLGRQPAEQLVEGYNAARADAVALAADLYASV